ncbi:MAG: GNAT family N-acetyltransferase [Anaerolineae bacterium]
MNKQQILALYDKEMRQEVDYSDCRREVTPAVVRLLSLQAPEGVVLYAWLTSDNQDTVIREQIAYFDSLGRKFEWKVHSHDTPPDLHTHLNAFGFTIEEAEALMILDLEHAPAILLQPIRHDVRRLTQPEQLSDVLTVQKAVWNKDFSWLTERMTNDLQHHPDRLSLYVAYVEGHPASSAWSYFHPGSHFAGLWGGSTLENYRGQGLYTALLAARAQEAISRGVRFLTVDASPMSRPILEKLGFQWVSTMYPCKWPPEPSAQSSD